MSYRYQATKTFWDNFYSLSSAQKESARSAWKIFKQDPFDRRLRTHKIHRLSALMRQTVDAVEIEGDLRVVFLCGGRRCGVVQHWNSRHLQEVTAAGSRLDRVLASFSRHSLRLRA